MHTLIQKSLSAGASPATEKNTENYRNCLTKIKRKARMEYYSNKCYALKSNMKKLWQLINNVINKNNNKTSIIEYITVNNIQYYGAKEVSNQFGIYYSKLGEKLSQKLGAGKVSISKYLEKIKTNPKSLFMDVITTTEISKHIDQLPSKNSTGYDRISNILLKRI